MRNDVPNELAPWFLMGQSAAKMIGERREGRQTFLLARHPLSTFSGSSPPSSLPTSSCWLSLNLVSLPRTTSRV